MALFLFPLFPNKNAEDKEAWGIPSFGKYNALRRITKEDYDGFGITWDWSPSGKGFDDIRHLGPDNLQP